MERFTDLITIEIVIYDAVLKQQADVGLVVSGSHLCFIVLKTKGGLCWRTLLLWRSLLLKWPTREAQVSTGPCAPSVPLVDKAEMKDARLSVHSDLITTMQGEWEGSHGNLNIFKKQTGFLVAILCWLKVALTKHLPFLSFFFPPLCPYDTAADGLIYAHPT